MASPRLTGQQPRRTISHKSLTGEYTPTLRANAGCDATVLSGQITYRHGEPTGALPGRVVKGQRVAQPKAA